MVTGRFLRKRIMVKTKTNTSEKILKIEVAKYKKWAASKGFFRDRYSLISYYNRKKKIVKKDGIYFITIGKRKYRLDEVEEIYNQR